MHKQYKIKIYNNIYINLFIICMLMFIICMLKLQFKDSATKGRATDVTDPVPNEL